MHFPLRTLGRTLHPPNNVALPLTDTTHPSCAKYLYLNCHKAPSRLTKKGILRRVDRGVYGYPEKSRLIGELSPRPEEVAKALARRGSRRLLPSGACAANLLGFTEQVPGKVEYLSDGPTRRVMIRKLPVALKQTTPARLATAGRVSGTVAQALRFLRKERVDDAIIEKLRKRLSEDDKKQLLRDIPLVPAWVAETFRRVAEPGAKQ